MSEPVRRTLRSEVPGIVALLHCEEGDKVEHGEIVMSIESMKTMWPVYATISGVVRLKVTLGQLVSQDEEVAVMEG